jgi:hypothetical protein
MPGLFGSTILDIAIGMAFVYFLLSVISSTVNELFAGFLKMRARDLEHGIANMLCDPQIASRVLNHPLIKAMGSTRTETGVVQFAAGGDVGAVATSIRQFLAWIAKPFKGAWSLLGTRRDFAGSPSYIPSRTFANALLDALDPERPGNILPDIVEQKTRELASETETVTDEVKKRVVELLKPAEGALTQINAATTLADLRTVVQSLTDKDVNLAAKKRILDALESRRDIGRALGSILDSSLEAGQLIVQVDKLKAMVERLTDAPDRQRVLDAFTNAKTLDDLKKTIGFLPEGDAQKVVLKAVDEAQAGLDRFRQGIETWYDDAMDRVSGVYRRRVRWWLIVIGGIIAIVLGADTIQIYRSLSTNPTARAAVVAQADNATATNWCVTPTATADQTPEPTPTAIPASTPTETDQTQVSQGQNLDCLVKQLDETNLGFGYGSRPPFDLDSDYLKWLFQKIVGLLFTTIAIALGAPFWFDTLSKISNLRAAGPAPKKAETDTK